LHFDAVGVAAPARRIDLDFVTGLLDGATPAFELHAHLAAFEHVAALFEADVAARAHFIGRLVVAQPVGVDRLAAAAQAHRPLGLDLALLVTLQVVGIDKQRQRPGIVRRQAQKRRLQLQPRAFVAGLEAERRTVGGGDGGAGAQQHYRNQS
jgi:hypothetical protein